jgi:hypothetical protein
MERTQSLICFGWLERAGVDAPTTAGLETGATVNDLIRRVRAGRGRVGGGFPTGFTRGYLQPLPPGGGKAQEVEEARG